LQIGVLIWADNGSPCIEILSGKSDLDSIGTVRQAVLEYEFENGHREAREVAVGNSPKPGDGRWN
jgi:hypothetical protein